MQKLKKMPHEKPTEEEFTEKYQENFEKSGTRQYGIYSAIVFQMLAIIALGFWGGKKLNDYYEVKNNLLTVGIGFLGFALSLYSTITALNRVNKNEKENS